MISPSRFAVLALALGAALPAFGQGLSCPPLRPSLTGPSSVSIGQSYTLAWTDVLQDVTSAINYYTVERSTDSTFTNGVDRVKTFRATATLPVRLTAAGTLYHRVVVSSTCETFAPVVSNTLAVKVTDACAAPDPVGELAISPASPPALTTYVVAWNTGGNGEPGPGGGPTGLKFRLRRITPYETKESVSDLGSAAFTDPAGVYTYQVRAEAVCGTAGPWSNPTRVVVGNAPVASLLLLSEPKTVATSGKVGSSATSFVVRNAGTTVLHVNADSGSAAVAVSPGSFSLGPNQLQMLSVSFTDAAPSAAAIHATVSLAFDGGSSLRVPIDAVQGALEAEASAGWNDVDANVNATGDEILRTVVNPGSTTATFVSSVRQKWLAVQSLDGLPWERPLRPYETRPVKIVIDRALRRSTFGTEVGVVTLTTIGHPDDTQKLVVVDDGPTIPYTIAQRPLAAGSRSRLLYAALPAAQDAAGGRSSSDLWLTNMDAVSPIEVALFFTPIGVAAAETRRVDQVLGPGETRRYRNLVGRVFTTYDGTCEVEVRSPAATLSATALVNSKPVASSARAASRAASSVSPLDTAGAALGAKDFEMRPILPGEGVKISDPYFVVSGLRHDAKRTSKLILTETSGFETTVRVSLFGYGGQPLTKDGHAVVLERKIPALSTIELLDEVLFDPAPLSLENTPYARVEFVSGYNDGFGGIRGSVLPLATVLDVNTSDFSVRMGVSTAALNPVPPPSNDSQASRGEEPSSSYSGLPYSGGAATLVFPVAHLRGALLNSGYRPFWKTRVTMTNVGSLTRQVTLRFIDASSPDDLQTARPTVVVPLLPGNAAVFDDIMENQFLLSIEERAYGSVVIVPTDNDRNTWADVDVQTDTYTPDPAAPELGDYKTGMEAFSYRHGYSSFQSNLGTVQFEGAENSSRYRTNLVLEEVGNAGCTVAIAAYLPGSFVPIAAASLTLPRFGYISKELFKGFLGLDLTEVTDVRVVVRQTGGDGVFMAFASRINLTTGGPANIFLRPASAGTGR